MDKLDKLISNISFSKTNDLPVWAFLVDKNFNVITKAKNTKEVENNVIKHAEVVCILKAQKKLQTWKLNQFSIISTHMPCLMCISVAHSARIKKIIYLQEKTHKEALFLNKVAEQIGIELFFYKINKKENNFVKDFFSKKRINE